MKKVICLLGFFGFLAIAATLPSTAIAVNNGEAAPDFTLQDNTGNEVSLSDYAGQKIVLEWTNHLCPYVRKHYDSGNMQALQKQLTEQDIVWLTILSSVPGKQGHLDAQEATAQIDKEGAAQTAYLLDPTGEVGKLYNAKTTPHMYLIDEDGVLQYQGAIDDNNSASIETVESAENYVLAALADLEADRPVAEPVTQAYGCAVKY